MNIETINEHSLNVTWQKDEQVFLYKDMGADDSSQWAVPWSDLMMTMFILFAMLFVFVSTKHDVFQEIVLDKDQTYTSQKSGAAEKEVSLNQIRMTIENRDKNLIVADQHLGDLEKILTPFPAEKKNPQKKEHAVFFRPAQAKLEQAAMNMLLEMGERLQKTGARIHLVGHGDEAFVPNTQFADNLALALARATEVSHFLVRECGIEKERILVSGQTNSIPLVPGNSRANQIRNRRVDITLL